MKVQCWQAHMEAVAVCVEPPTAPNSWRPGRGTPTVPADREERQVFSISAWPRSHLSMSVTACGEKWELKATSTGMDGRGSGTPPRWVPCSHTEPCQYSCQLRPTWSTRLPPCCTSPLTAEWGTLGEQPQPIHPLLTSIQSFLVLSCYEQAATNIPAQRFVCACSPVS